MINLSMTEEIQDDAIYKGITSNALSMTRQEYLAHQLDINQQMQFKIMQEKVSQYQAKLASEF